MSQHIRIINIHQSCIVKHAAKTSYLRANVTVQNTYNKPTKIYIEPTNIYFERNP
jgi:hypothetical protein